MDQTLKYSLENVPKTTAKVTTQSEAQECIRQATDYWVITHLNTEWHIIEIDLTLECRKTTAINDRTVTTKESGILARHTYHGLNARNLLIVFSADRYTETWVHALVDALASDPSCRILCVWRDDKGEAIDLGDWNLARS